jgi:hypothetical protein
MSIPILSRFYALFLRDEPNYDSEFIGSCKAIAAFYTLWRSALSNKGLDDVYRKLLRENVSWEKGNVQLTLDYLKTYLKDSLNNKQVGTKDQWKSKATQDLRYDTAQKICRFALLITAHDTIPDDTPPGLMRLGTPNSSPHLDPEKWDVDSSFKSIEHVAPQNPPNNTGWDSDIYTNINQQRIGNLVLLPTAINVAASNRDWSQKWIYYQHLAETDPKEKSNLASLAASRGYTLSPKVLDKLQSANHNQHMRSVVNIGIDGTWDNDLIKKRTERICDILWDRLYEWLT